MKKRLIILTPLIVALVLLLMTKAFEFLRQPSDSSVFLGVILLCIIVALILFLVLYVKKGS